MGEQLYKRKRNLAFNNIPTQMQYFLFLVRDQSLCKGCYFHTQMPNSPHPLNQEAKRYCFFPTPKLVTSVHAHSEVGNHGIKIRRVLWGISSNRLCALEKRRPPKINPVLNYERQVCTRVKVAYRKSFPFGVGYTETGSVWLLSVLRVQLTAIEQRLLHFLLQSYGRTRWSRKYQWNQEHKKSCTTFLKIGPC